MSQLNGAHNILSYTGKEKALDGQRISSVTYKVDKKTGIKPASVYASVPRIASNEIADSIDKFLPHMIALCERTQDAIVRNTHEAGNKLVSDADISVAAILEYLSAESSGGRLTKVAVSDWFDEVISDPLAVALANKMGVSETPSDEESKQIEKLVSEFRNNISSLTSPVKYEPDTCKVLIKALNFAPSDDVIASRFISKLETMSRKVPVSMADAL